MEEAQNTAPVTSLRAVKTFESRDFNGFEDSVATLKTQAAKLWDLIDGTPIPPGNSEAGRLVSLAKTDLESAVMWAVKGYSRIAAPLAEGKSA